VFRRLSTPDTAYDIGYAKYEEERFGVDRDGGDEDGWEDREESVVVGIGQRLRFGVVRLN